MVLVTSLGRPRRALPSAGMTLTDAETAALEALDETALVAHLVALVQTPSITASDAESQLCHDEARRMEAAGMGVDHWALDLAALHADADFPGTEVPRTEGYGLVGTLGPQDQTPALVLQGHLDVVPTGDRAKWARDPFDAHVAGRTLHGRGACDMKGGVAVNLAVATALRRSGLTLDRPLAVHAVVSEEDGGLGALGTLRRGHTGEVAVLTEPTSGRIVTANAGALTFELRVPGRAAHGSTRAAGVSAIDAFVVIDRAIKEFEASRNAIREPRLADVDVPYATFVGTVRAGDWATNVPDLLVAEGRLGVRLEEDPADARAALEAAVRAAADAEPFLRDNPPTLSWPGAQFAPGALPDGHRLVGAMASAVRSVGGAEPAVGAAPYGSDLRLYVGVGGIPSLHFGPGDVRYAHAPREQVDLDEVIAVARALVVLAVRECSAHR